MDADSMWDHLGSLEKDTSVQSKIIYRGHANSDWQFLPTVLRPGLVKDIKSLFESPIIMSEDQIHAEFYMLRQFIYSCDEAGISVPNDSMEFRESSLSPDRLREYLKAPSQWPNNEVIESMVMARLHALPTRLLDWTTDPYVAAYFASSEALRSQKRWIAAQKMAIFLLKIRRDISDYLGPVRILRICGDISKNLVVQKGVFTVHPVLQKAGERIVIKSIEEYLPPDSSLVKITVPVEECVRLYALCNQFNYNAARLYPTADGASMSVADNLSFALAQKAIDKDL